MARADGYSSDAPLHPELPDAFDSAADELGVYAPASWVLRPLDQMGERPRPVQRPIIIPLRRQRGWDVGRGSFCVWLDAYGNTYGPLCFGGGRRDVAPPHLTLPEDAYTAPEPTIRPFRLEGTWRTPPRAIYGESGPETIADIEGWDSWPERNRASAIAGEESTGRTSSRGEIRVSPEAMERMRERSAALERAIEALAPMRQHMMNLGRASAAARSQIRSVRGSMQGPVGDMGEHYDPGVQSRIGPYDHPGRFALQMPTAGGWIVVQNRDSYPNMDRAMVSARELKERGRVVRVVDLVKRVVMWPPDEQGKM